MIYKKLLLSFCLLAITPFISWICFCESSDCLIIDNNASNNTEFTRVTSPYPNFLNTKIRATFSDNLQKVDIVNVQEKKNIFSLKMESKIKDFKVSKNCFYSLVMTEEEIIYLIDNRDGKYTIFKGKNGYFINNKLIYINNNLLTIIDLVTKEEKSIPNIDVWSRYPAQLKDENLASILITFTKADYGSYVKIIDLERREILQVIHINCFWDDCMLGSDGRFYFIEYEEPRYDNKQLKYFDVNAKTYGIMNSLLDGYRSNIL